MKNILYISSFLPFNTPYAGSKTAFSILKSLSAEHKLDVVTFYNKYEQEQLDDFYKYAESNENIKKISHIKVSNINRARNCILMFFMPLILISRFDFVYLLKNFNQFKKYDLIHVEFSQSLFFSFFISKLFKIKTSVSIADVILQSYQRKYLGSKSLLFKGFYSIEIFKLKLFEKLFLKNASLVTVQSLKDKELLIAQYGLDYKKIMVLSPNFYKLPLVPVRKPNQADFRVLLWGAYNRYENEKAFFNFLESCLERLVISIPNFKFIVCGVNPTKMMQISGKENESIVITGFVEDPNVIFSTIDVAVVPLSIGAGIKVKTLECLYTGLPVVTTSIGAEGIPEFQNMIIEDKISGFSEIIENIYKYGFDFDREISRKKLDVGFNQVHDLKNINIAISRISSNTI